MHKNFVFYNNNNCEWWYVQLRAVTLEGVYEGDITFISHLVRESGINLDEQLQGEVRVLRLNG